MSIELPGQIKDAKILVTGASGLVGSTVARVLRQAGAVRVFTPTSSELNLMESPSVENYFVANKPQIVLMIAARVGGIKANATQPVEFTHDNLLMQLNLYAACHRHKTLCNLFMGSSCIYPRLCPQPMREEYLQTGLLEPTNEGYALSKLVGLRMADFYLKQYGMRTICPLACNIYGPNDSFDLDRAHVLSSLVRKFVDARDQKQPRVMLWGTGNPRRELMHVDDLAEAMLFLLGRHFGTQGPLDARPINVGTGIDHSIKQIAGFVRERVGYNGTIVWDAAMPDGMPVKRLETSVITEWGFVPRIALEQGIGGVIEAYRDFKAKSKVNA